MMMSVESVLDLIQCSGDYDSLAGKFSSPIASFSQGQLTTSLSAAEGDRTDNEEIIFSGGACQLSRRPVFTLHSRWGDRQGYLTSMHPDV